MEVLTRCTTCAAFFLTFLFAIANCQSPTLSGNGLYFVEGQTRVMLCYVTTADNPANFPLTWEKNGQVLNASSQSVNPNSGFYQYISYLNLPVQASDNGQSLTCKYQNQSPGASWIIYVKRAPDYPSLSGKTNVTWGMTYNWTCTVGGATSLSESDVRWQFGNGTTITSGITSTLSNATYSYNITTFTVTKVLTLAIPRGNLDFSLLCSVNHELLNNAPREGTLSVSVFYPPVVTTATTNYTVTTHSTATLTCQVSAQPAVASVTWYKDGGVLSRTSGRFQNGDTTQPSLVVTNVQKEDGGQYICSAANSLGGTNGSAILLTVLYPPEVTYNTTVFGARVGESVTLLCVVDAKPGANNVTWWRVNITNGVRILLTPASSAGKYSGGTATTPSLTINNLTAADTSYYRCGASNDVGSGEGTNVQVQVFYAPTVTVSATSYTRNETDVLVITCSYDANPTPVNVTWTRNSQSVDVAASGGKYSGSSMASPSLTVTGLTRSDAGLYVCAVTNTIGTGRSPNVTVDVNYSPVVVTPVTYYNESRGGSVRLNCEVTANPAPTAVQWYKDGSLLATSGSPSKYSGGTTSSPALTVYNLTANDTGKYTCRATNSLGVTDGSNITLDVTYAPTVTVPATSYTRNETDVLVITCSYDANPTPVNVTWTRNSQSVDVAASGGKYSGSSVASPSLTVTGLTRSDAGLYVCAVTNTIGTGRSPNVTVDVNYAPVITTPVTSYNGSRGASVTLKCEVTANPAATVISWYKDGSTIVTSGSNGKYTGGTPSTPDLTVNTLSGNDSGKYICRAINSLGFADSSNISLDVTYAPIVTVSATSYTRNETDVLVITCSYDANPTPVNVTWTRNSQSVDVAASGGKYSGSSVASPSLTVTGLTRSDAGLYVCAVTNTIGTGRSPDVTVDVNYSPVVHSPVVYYNGSRGGSVTLKCEVTANPAPTAISWYKDRSLVNISESNGKYTGGTTSTPDLTINSLSGSDGGSFFCRASNSLGSTDGNDIRLEVTYAPLITSGSAPRTATELSTLTLPCAYDANPVPSRILWAKNSTTITLPSPSYSGASPGNPSLTILSLSPEDTGSYVCTVVNSLGNASSGAIMLTVQYAPRVDSGLDSQKTSLAGQNVTIPCNVTAAVPAVTLVTWLRDGAVFPVSNGTKYGGGTVGTPPLTILRVASSDAATYTCRVTNDVGTREGRNVTLIVQYKPEVFVPQSLTGVESQTLSLECRVAADPAVTSVRWKKDGKLLDTSDSARFSGGNVSTPSLTISGLGAGDAGNYSCTADNSVGSTESANVTLSVQYSPVFTVPQTEVVGVVGQDVNLSISVRAYPEVTTLLWYKRDPASSALNQIDVRLSKYSGGVAGSPSLIITQLNSTDSGVYVAEAVNAVSTRRSPEITVVVSYPPAPPVISGQAGSYKEGEQIVMTCTSGAFPTPVYDWYRDSIVYRQNSSVLNISSATADDNSQFKCRAYNSLGYSETTVTVVVQYKPRPSLTLSNVTATSGNPVTLSCDTDANPPPTNFTWYFAGRVVSTGSRTLTVVVNASTTGTYTCIASNSQGDSGPVDVVVTPDAGGGDTGNTGASTNTGGISVATLVLIIIICIIFVVAVVLVVVYVCSGSRCSRKKNEVSQAPLATALTLPHVAPSKNGAAKLPPPRKAPPHAKISVNDDADVPPSPPPSPSTAAKAESQLGNGLIISLPGGTGGGPRPHRLPPLSSTGGAPREVEPAVDGDDENKKPTKKRRRKRQPEEEGLTSEPPTPQQSPQRQLQDDSVDV